MNGSDDKGQENVQNGGILPPEEQERSRPPSTQNILALIANYTERPDLVLETLEKHDPGFIKRMIQYAEVNAERAQEAAFSFSKAQAYASLMIRVLAVPAILFFVSLVSQRLFQ